MRPHIIRCGCVLNSLNEATCYGARPHVMHMRCGRMLVNVIWSLIYFHTNILREFSLWVVNFLNIYLLFNSDFVNFVLKTDGGGEGVWEWGCRRPYFVIFVFWGCFNCWWVRCSGVGQKFLFRTGGNRMFLFIQGCEGELKISLRDPTGGKFF